MGADTLDHHPLVTLRIPPNKRLKNLLVKNLSTLQEKNFPGKRENIRVSLFFSPNSDDMREEITEQNRNFSLISKALF